MMRMRDIDWKEYKSLTPINFFFEVKDYSYMHKEMRRGCGTQVYLQIIRVNGFDYKGDSKTKQKSTYRKQKYL